MTYPHELKPRNRPNPELFKRKPPAQTHNWQRTERPGDNGTFYLFACTSCPEPHLRAYDFKGPNQ